MYYKAGMDPRQMMPDSMQDYREWLRQQHCERCGTAYRDKKPDEFWVTEWECMRCYEKRLQALPCPYKRPRQVWKKETQDRR